MPHIRIITQDDIEDFKGEYPDSKLPDELNLVRVEFDENGDLVACIPFDTDGVPMKLSNVFDLTHLTTLIADHMWFRK